MKKEVVLSGIRPTGRLHFGSLLGAVQQFVRYQDDPNTAGLYFIADLHALTTTRDPEAIRSNLIEMVKDYLAAGLDPKRSVIYAQSSVPEIPELALLLSMLQPRGELDGLATLKDLRRKGDSGFTLGMTTYPVLMAADILGPQATLVPVGEDQKPNVELARNLAGRFNRRFERELFTIPEAAGDLIRVPGLDGDKMGKSNAENAVDIGQDRETILGLYRRQGITDANRVSLKDPGDPNACKSVYPIHRLVTPSERDGEGEIANLCRSAGIGCTDCKVRLVNNIMTILEPFQERRDEFADQDDYVRDILRDGGLKARELIKPTLEAVADCMGLTRFN